MAQSSVSINSPAKTWQANFIRFSTSLLVLFVSFVIVNTTHQFVQGSMSRGMGYETKVSFTRVDSLPKVNKYWSSKRVLVLYALPVVGLLLTSVACFLLLERRKVDADDESELLHKNGLIQLFLFWVGICSFNAAIAQLMIMPLGRLNPLRNEMYQDASVVANWFGLPPLFTIGMSVVSFIITLFAGFYTGKHFCEKLSYSKSELTKSRGRLGLMWRLYLLPVFLLTPLVFVLTYPMSPLVHLAQVVGLLWIGIGIFTYFELRGAQLFKIKGKDVTNRVSFDLLIVLVALVVVIKLVLRY